MHKYTDSVNLFRSNTESQLTQLLSGMEVCHILVFVRAIWETVVTILMIQAYYSKDLLLTLQACLT